MQLIVRISGRVYELLVSFYPRDLRTQFGADMVGVFEDFFSDALVERGIIGAVSVGGMVLWEFASVALPLRLKSRGVIAGAASILISSIIAWIFFRSVG